MSGFVATEKGVPIRQPSTANLMVDSADRNSVDLYPNDFIITRKASILNGFFTRISTAEVVLEWKTPNVSLNQGNDTIVLDISGVAPQTITLPDAFYTVYGAVQVLVGKLNDISGVTSVTWAAAALPGDTGYTLTPTPLATTYWRMSGTLADQLGLSSGGAYIHNVSAAVYNGQADLRPVRFLDFVSPQLTYQQELKDATTSITNSFDVLCRWYFAFDNPVAYDAYGFPILMGYQPFVLRRIFSPPKYIRWNPSQPLGQMQFTVYNDKGQIANMNVFSNWLMTLQISEV